ncbi:MAG TPA: Sec-independent protein translocase subunit TatA [Glaciihabitans sp.]|jgi:sec-independent protein translocase protein TatA|nr:Sec-independent protein translocase subunit TatA [Glaciihabitans sp.]
MAGLTGWHLIIILAIILLLFGAPRLPALARSLGQSMRIFKSEIKTQDDDKTGTADATDATAPRNNGSTPSSSTTVNPADTNPKP